MKNSDSAAFPYVWEEEYESDWHATGGESGLSKREWLAGLAMQAMLRRLSHDVSIEVVAREAVQAADALLSALAKE